MEELMVKIEKMDFEKQQLEAEKIELIEKKNALQKESLDAQKELAVAKVKSWVGAMLTHWFRTTKSCIITKFALD